MQKYATRREYSGAMGKGWVKENDMLQFHTPAAAIP